MYKKLFVVSLAINIALAVVLVVLMRNRNTPEEEKMIQQLRAVQKSVNKKVLIKESDEIKNASVEIMEEISKDWDPNILIKKFSPAILAKIGRQKIEQITQLYKILGAYKKHSIFSATGYPMRPDSIVVSMPCDFEKGKGFVRLVLTKQNDRWMIEGININSELFLPPVLSNVKKSEKR